MSYLIIKVINSAFALLQLAILLECIASWVPQLRYNSFMEAIYKITTPVLEPFRQLQNRFLGNSPIDFSPIIALAVLEVIKDFIFKILL